MHQLHLIKLEAICIKTRYQCYDKSSSNLSRLIQLRDQYQEIRQKYNHVQTEYFANLTFPGKIQSLRYAEHYKNTVYLKFMDWIFPAPEVYMGALVSIYGPDFMVPMPGKSMHEELLVNTNISYTDNYSQFMSL